MDQWSQWLCLAARSSCWGPSLSTDLTYMHLCYTQHSCRPNAWQNVPKKCSCWSANEVCFMHRCPSEISPFNLVQYISWFSIPYELVNFIVFWSSLLVSDINNVYTKIKWLSFVRIISYIGTKRVLSPLSKFARLLWMILVKFSLNQDIKLTLEIYSTCQWPYQAFYGSTMLQRTMYLNLHSMGFLHCDVYMKPIKTSQLHCLTQSQMYYTHPIARLLGEKGQVDPIEPA